MRNMMQNTRMAAAESSVDMFSCANIALSLDASILASILFAVLDLGLRLRGLLLNLLVLFKRSCPKDIRTNFA